MSSKPSCLVPKVATRGVLKKLLLKISQYSQDNACVGVTF